MQENGLESKAKDLNFMMTSELGYKSSSLEDSYGQEFRRRLSSICLKDEQVASLYQAEKLILSAVGKLSEERQKPWVLKYFFNEDLRIKTIPQKELLTLSELILITEEAMTTCVRYNKVFSDEVWGWAMYTAKEFKDRAKGFGWSRAQDRAFTKNECLLVDKLKWGYSFNPAWTPETCDLSQFQK